jgi:hypothetical protein
MVEDYPHFVQFTYQDGECLRWSGFVTPSGYPQYRDPDTGLRVLAHRWIYTKEVAPIPYGLVIDHVYERGCRYTDCVRVEHLEAVSTRENGRRTSLAQTHCKHGHEFTPENTAVSTNRLGYTERHCKTCRRDAQARYRARLKAGV